MGRMGKKPGRGGHSKRVAEGPGDDPGRGVGVVEAIVGAPGGGPTHRSQSSPAGTGSAGKAKSSGTYSFPHSWRSSVWLYGLKRAAPIKLDSGEYGVNTALILPNRPSRMNWQTSRMAGMSGTGCRSETPARSGGRFRPNGALPGPSSTEVSRGSTSLPALGGIDDLQRVPMIRRGDEHRVYVLPSQQFPVIIVGGAGAVCAGGPSCRIDVIHRRARAFPARRINFANRDQLETGVVGQSLQMSAAHRAFADETDREPGCPKPRRPPRAEQGDGPLRQGHEAGGGQAAPKKGPAREPLGVPPRKSGFFCRS